MRLRMTHLVLFSAVIFLAGCHPAGPPKPTAQDIEVAKQDAARELAQARIEASKDIKSAVKVAGSSSKEVSMAKATASYDIAMAKADGEHKIATEQCLTLQAPMVQPCKDKADAEYESAKAAAKKLRLTRDQ